jgi:hypothetical protein
MTNVSVPQYQRQTQTEEVSQGLKAGVFVMAGVSDAREHAVHEAQSFAGACDVPLKVALPKELEVVGLLKPGKPCKKRVPEWSCVV